MNNHSSSAVNIEQPCIHDVKVDIVNGIIITYCVKCGMILSTQPVFTTIL